MNAASRRYLSTPVGPVVSRQQITSATQRYLARCRMESDLRVRVAARTANRTRHEAYLVSRQEAMTLLSAGRSLLYQSGRTGGFFTLPSGATVAALRLLVEMGVNWNWTQLQEELRERDPWEGGIFALTPPPGTQARGRASWLETELAAY